MNRDRIQREIQLIVLALAAGILATVAALSTPLMGSMPPLLIPYFPLDLRLVLIPLALVLAQGIRVVFPWPLRGTLVLILAALAAVPTHAHQSATLAYVNFPGARGGSEVELLPALATLGSLLIALWITFQESRDRFSALAKERGLGEDQRRFARERGVSVAKNAVVMGAVGAGTLLAGLRVVGHLLAGARMPFAEVIALVLVVGLGALYVGLQHPSIRDKKA